MATKKTKRVTRDQVKKSKSNSTKEGSALKPVDKTQSMTVEDLANAGIDMKVTKADILEALMAEIKEQAEEEQEKLLDAELDLRIQLLDKMQKYIRTEFKSMYNAAKKISSDPGCFVDRVYGGRRKPVTLILKIDTRFTNTIDHMKESRETYKADPEDFDPKHRRSMRERVVDFDILEGGYEFCHENNEKDVFKYETHITINKLPEEVLSLKKKHKDVTERLLALRKEINNMGKNERRARYELVQRILSGTPEGTKLLGMFDNFKTKKVKQLQELLESK